MHCYGMLSYSIAIIEMGRFYGFPKEKILSCYVICEDNFHFFIILKEQFDSFFICFKLD